MYILNDTFSSPIATYPRSSYRSSGHPGRRQRPPGLPAPSLLRVAEMKTGETQPPTGATSPAAHTVRRHHLADSAVFVCVEQGESGCGGGGETRLIRTAPLQYVANMINIKSTCYGATQCFCWWVTVKPLFIISVSLSNKEAMSMFR